jgi:hypothetical protein
MNVIATFEQASAMPSQKHRARAILAQPFDDDVGQPHFFIMPLRPVIIAQ